MPTVIVTALVLPGPGGRGAGFRAALAAEGQDRLLLHAGVRDQARTRLEREFRPEAVRQLKESADQDLSIGVPTLAAHAQRRGLPPLYRVPLTLPAQVSSPGSTLRAAGAYSCISSPGFSPQAVVSLERKPWGFLPVVPSLTGSRIRILP
jgi:hypothetical protein